MDKKINYDDNEIYNIIETNYKSYLCGKRDKTILEITSDVYSYLMDNNPIITVDLLEKSKYLNKLREFADVIVDQNIKKLYEVSILKGNKKSRIN